ncbi:hypothetical protein ACFWZS_21695 [[Kitasatospora] papulosa]|uniref:hypothetical protein n=1 Tax=[Kitasatospora] papulosa TaxID=1464011 RepID=UPI0036C4AC34
MRAPGGQFSRRRAYLATLGAAWLGYGAGIIIDPRYGTARGLGTVVRYVPLDVLGGVWVGCGLLAVTAAWLTSCPRVQAAGFAALAAPAALWGAAFTITWAGGGFPSAGGSAAAWVGFALSVVWVSGMDDPLPPHLRKRYR